MSLSSLAGRSGLHQWLPATASARPRPLEMARLGATVGVNDLKSEFMSTRDGGRDRPRPAGKAIGMHAEHVPPARRHAFEAVLGLARETGRLDVMVNNAAWVRYQPLAEITPEVMDRMVDVGFKSVVWGIQAGR
jgi:3-oxoacyl-[acyl-carrier protein] reductase